MAVQAKQNDQENVPVVNQEQSKSDTKEYNFAQLRKQMEASEREKVMAQQKADAYEKELSELRNKRLSDKEDDDDDHYDEPYVDEKRLNKKLAKFERSFERKVNETAELKAKQLLEQEKQTSFLKQNSDFNEIINPEMIQKFVNKHPEIAEPMLEMPNNFARQKLLYQNIKALGLHKPPVPDKPIQDKIEANRRSPYYQPSGISNPPYANQGDFSEDGQKQAHKKMQELKKRLRI
jgi:hypothetical protein